MRAGTESGNRARSTATAAAAGSARAATSAEPRPAWRAGWVTGYL